MFDTRRKAHEIALERLRFQNSTKQSVSVKSAPWSALTGAFGTVRLAAGSRYEVLTSSGVRMPYTSLDAMLEDWIGD